MTLQTEFIYKFILISFQISISNKMRFVFKKVSKIINHKRIFNYKSYFNMESIIPKCSNNKLCSHVCNVKLCKANPFLCADDQCLCYYKHQKCVTSMRWKGMRQLFLNKIKKSSAQFDRYFTQIDDLYKSIIKQIEISFISIKNIFNNFGLSQLEREVYQKLKQQKFGSLTGQMINKVEIELMQQNNQFEVRNIDKQKKQIEKQTKILIQMLEELTKFTQKKQSQTLFKLDSKITQDIDTLCNFFPKKITGMNLLYRASENNFQASKFHEKCDGKQNTITILKTQFGNIIGGYTPVPWNKSKLGYQADSSMQSFIFSLTNKHKLALIKAKQGNAIIQDSGWGPAFDIDLQICNKANLNSNSNSRPGYTYNYNNEYIYGTQQSYKKFNGQSSGYRFKLQEWQVYSIVFV